MKRSFFLFKRNFATLSQVAGPLAGLAIALIPVGSFASEEVLSRTQFLMGTTCTIEADVKASGIEAAFGEIGRIEGFLSTWRTETELSNLNRTAGSERGTVSPELFDVIKSALDWSCRTQGSFNPLVGPLIDLWQVRENGALPTDNAIDRAVASVRLDNVQLDPRSTAIRLAPGSELEEGGFGKGYAIDRAIDELVVAGCNDCLIDFGGQIAVRSMRAREVLVASPASRERPAMSINVRQGSVATTSGSEKWFDTPTGRLSHIIDPRTGRALPPRGSTTVVHASAFVADILSTALYVMGPEQGLEWADENDVAAIFILPSDSGWTVMASDSAQTPSLGLTSVSADFSFERNH